MHASFLNIPCIIYLAYLFGSQGFPPMIVVGHSFLCARVLLSCDIFVFALTHSCTEAVVHALCFRVSFFVVFDGVMVSIWLMCMSSGMFISLLLNSLNTRPCFGFVRTSAHISSAGQYFSDISFWSTLSLIKKISDLYMFCALWWRTFSICFQQ